MLGKVKGRLEWAQQSKGAWEDPLPSRDHVREREGEEGFRGQPFTQSAPLQIRLTLATFTELPLCQCPLGGDVLCFSLLSPQGLNRLSLNMFYTDFRRINIKDTLHVCACAHASIGITQKRALTTVTKTVTAVHLWLKYDPPLSADSSS